MEIKEADVLWYATPSCGGCREIRQATVIKVEGDYVHIKLDKPVINSVGVSKEEFILRQKDLDKYLYTAKENIKLTCDVKQEERRVNEEKKEDITAFSYLAQKRKIKYLIHFTPLENVISILKHGICSRLLCNQMGIEPQITDEKRLDDLLNFSCFSISFPNYRMMYKKTNEHGTRFAVLKIDISVMKNIAENQVVYCDGNAAAESSSKRYGLIGVQSLFYDHNSRMAHAKLEYATNPEAEILIQQPILPKFITAIYVKEEKDKEWLKKKVSGNFRIIKDEKFFKYREDYEYWR